MRIFRNKRKETIGTYNFGHYQIYVCTFINTKGETNKGISVQSSNTFVEVPFVLSKSKALEFSSYLISVANGDLPKNFHLGRFFMRLYFKFTRLSEGLLKGRISLSGSTWVTVKKSSVLSCAEAINQLYNENYA